MPRHHPGSGNPRARNAGLVLALVLGLSAACGKESQPVDAGVLTPSTLHYDAGHLSSPALQPGEYEAGARFTSSQTGKLKGHHLTDVEYYVATKPAQCTIKVYDAGDATTPGGLLYAADVTVDVHPDHWNDHKLAHPVALSGGDVWVCVAFSDTLIQGTIGCDPGPAVPDGDWLYASADSLWLPLRQRVPVSINWNIRGLVDYSR